MNSEPTQMTHQSLFHPGDPKPPLALDSDKAHQSSNTHVESQSLSSETNQLHREEAHEERNKEADEGKNDELRRLSLETECDSEETMSTQEVAEAEDNGRERLKRHRREVAGRVWIPEIWGQEDLLKDWIDCSAFDACLVPSGISSARAALIEEGRRANSGGLGVEKRFIVLSSLAVASRWLPNTDLQEKFG